MQQRPDNQREVSFKKDYNAPELIEHGDIEEITGTLDSEYGCSGKIYKV